MFARPGPRAYHRGVERIESIDDPRVAVYRDLPDRVRRRGGRFVTEGRLLTRRLIESSYAVESILASESVGAEFEAAVGGAAPVYVADKALLSRIVGYRFHRGVLGCGLRGEGPDLDGVMAAAGREGPLTLMVCPRVENAENLGSLYRVGAGFGVAGMVLGAGGADPLSRRCLRVSMGTVFSIPTAACGDLAGGLERLRGDWGLELVAAVLDEDAEPLAGFVRSSRTAVLFGSESAGLADDWLAICDRRVTIPMRLGTDSLNLAVAAGIVVYELTRAAPPAVR